MKMSRVCTLKSVRAAPFPKRVTDVHVAGGLSHHQKVSVAKMEYDGGLRVSFFITLKIDRSV